ncbi:hypothetical protein FJT64_023010 [Amphibalanus amphitrite]|uniref:Uncharacterized protein n=1 Tax=Amphibalanus amphitrite TaxID=1232801 RepID=A0A6A4WRU3_AMPAM|nr:hypothetical protein FJT64_023010 [Amphibalanus amphitrite]
MERQKQELQWKMQELELDTEREILKAKQGALLKFEEEEGILVSVLKDQNKQSHLPLIEPGVFSGSIDKFPLWLKAFETYVEHRTSSPVERLHFLSRYTEGDAHSAIAGFLHLRTTWKRLVDSSVYGPTPHYPSFADFVQLVSTEGRIACGPVAEKMPEYHADAEIGLLLGVNCPRIIKPREVIPGEEDDPWAVRTLLGWGIVGCVSEGEPTGCFYVGTGELLKKDCNWFEFRFNVPMASSMGGAWERIIRSVRSALIPLIMAHGHTLDDELFRTDYDRPVNRLILLLHDREDSQTGSHEAQ